ncbi:DUF5681 domain-containing protein [Neokomagataea anthophila]|uniref:DUF5681 domain-containing protein n=1 Tax=Neokomagataea anthophila TaxID=2826925 RepID=A0ABS5E828_9PROT|nr:DUF5681 domain-containing protein [Neokomagataea anthophila]MBR0560060.1 hypothetical protein [Neokomagataea anthophila]
MTKAPQNSGAKPRKMPVGRPFKKGQSGNPGGLPKNMREVIALARSHTTTAIEALAEIAGNKTAPESARVSAANSLLDRAWGKPKDTVEIQGQDGAPLGLVVTMVRPSE